MLDTIVLISKIVNCLALFLSASTHVTQRLISRGVVIGAIRAVRTIVLRHCAVSAVSSVDGVRAGANGKRDQRKD